jgi:hypothetical protein
MLHNFPLQQFSAEIYSFSGRFFPLFILLLFDNITSHNIIYPFPNNKYKSRHRNIAFRVARCRNHMQISSFLLVLCEYLDVSRKD